MSRSTLFAKLARSIRIARFCDERGLSTDDGLAEVEKLERRAYAQKLQRRELLKAAGSVALAGAAVSALAPLRGFAAPPVKATYSVGIIGAGLAGLACADTLRG